MPSKALKKWQRSVIAQLDPLRTIHADLTGRKAGRPRTTQQVVDAYIILLSGLFQQYCRDIYQEALNEVVTAVDIPRLRPVMYKNFQWQLDLDSRNAQPASLGSDFGRLGIDFWTRLRSRDSRNLTRQNKLESLNAWRNAVAHQDFVLSDDFKKKAGKTRRTWPTQRTGRLHSLH
jgi:hypothetical protein